MGTFTTYEANGIKETHWEIEVIGYDIFDQSADIDPNVLREAMVSFSAHYANAVVELFYVETQNCKLTGEIAISNKTLVCTYNPDTEKETV